MLNIEIPKVIHYCWFGKSVKPRLVKDCIGSWKYHFKDYKIIEWNEENYKTNHPFFIQAIEKRLWAFASDFARLDILNKYGGIYLDTDMLITKSFDFLLTNKVNIGAESIDFINGAFIATAENQTFLLDCLSFYDNLILSTNENDLMQMTIPRVMTKILFDNYFNLQEFNRIIVEKDIMIFPPEYLYPLPYSKKMELNNYKEYLTENSVGVHLWSASWKKYTALYYFEHKKYFKGLLILSREFTSRMNKLKKLYVQKAFKMILKQTIV